MSLKPTTAIRLMPQSANLLDPKFFYQMLINVKYCKKNKCLQMLITNFNKC